MPISLAIDTSPLNLSPGVRPPRPARDMSHLLSDEEADQLLAALVQARWNRLACQDADPLGMLFNDRAKQWTVGWEPQQPALLLLVWETDSWQNKPCWSLYRNGQLIFQACEGLSAQRQHWLSQLLEGSQLPTIEPAELLAPLNDFRYAQDNLQAIAQIRQTVAIHPELLDTVKDTLFMLLEAELNKPEWPTLEVLKLHRLSHKNPIISLFRDWLQQGKITAADTERLTSALNRLRQDYLTLGQTIQPLFQASYQQANQEFRTLLSNCQWRIQMLKALPVSPVQPARYPASADL